MTGHRGDTVGFTEGLTGLSLWRVLVGRDEKTWNYSENLRASRPRVPGLMEGSQQLESIVRTLKKGTWPLHLAMLCKQGG